MLIWWVARPSPQTVSQSGASVRLVLREGLRPAPFALPTRGRYGCYPVVTRVRRMLGASGERVQTAAAPLYKAASWVASGATPNNPMSRATLKQLASSDISARTPARPRKRN